MTNERSHQTGPPIRLAVVPYAQVGGSDRPRIRPGQAGSMLDRLVNELRAIPDFASRDWDEEE